jgi:hypothetical protein
MTEDVILCCVVRAVTHLSGGDRWVWSSGGMMISKGKLKVFDEEPAPLQQSSP